MAALAALGAMSVFADEASGAPEAPAPSPSATSHVVVLAPNMGRVVLVFAKPPFGRITVTVAGAVVPDDAVVLESDVPAVGVSASASARAPASAAASAPSAAPSSSAAPSGPVRYSLFAPEGQQSIRVTTENGYEAYVQTNVVPASSVDVAVDPQPPPPPPGGMPPPSYAGSGCCGGDHGASQAHGRSATPSIAAAAIAAAALLLRRGSDRDR